MRKTLACGLLRSYRKHLKISALGLNALLTKPESNALTVASAMAIPVLLPGLSRSLPFGSKHTDTKPKKQSRTFNPYKMKDILVSLFVIFSPLAACCAVFHRTVRAELRNLGGKR
jgi:hypothetical protein